MGIVDHLDNTAGKCFVKEWESMGVVVGWGDGLVWGLDVYFLGRWSISVTQNIISMQICVDLFSML